MTQLGVLLLPARSGRQTDVDDILQRIGSDRLTERLNTRRLSELVNPLHSGRMSEAIQGLADEAAFLPPPPFEILVEPEPDRAAQQQMLLAASDYLSRITADLPNFVASRRTTLLIQSFASADPSVAALQEVPFHLTGAWEGTVIYRNGKEVTTEGPGQSSPPESALAIYGTFGPFLQNTVGVALTQPRSMTWGRWEHGTAGWVAVFRFEVPVEKTLYYRLSGCCSPGTGDQYGLKPAYHGEVTIDPANGTILRAAVQADLAGYVPSDRSDVLVEYGPVQMGGKTYTVPLHSIAVQRGRTKLDQRQGDWDATFQSCGAFATQIREFTFDHYRVYRTRMRILPDFHEVPNGDSQGSLLLTGPKQLAAGLTSPQRD